MSLVEIKAILSAAVFLSGAFGVLLPSVKRRGDPGESFLVWGDAFAGGILAGAGLVHLLSAAAADFHALAPELRFPLAFALSGAGFLLVLLFEAVILADPDPSKSPLHSASKPRATRRARMSTRPNPLPSA